MVGLLPLWPVFLAEDEADADAEVVRGLAAHAVRVVVELDRTEVNAVVNGLKTSKNVRVSVRGAVVGMQESFKRFVVPDRIEDAHPSLQPGFRAMAGYLFRKPASTGRVTPVM